MLLTGMRNEEHDEQCDDDDDDDGDGHVENEKLEDDERAQREENRAGR